MAKYTSVTVSGYNSVPPSDDGTVSEANKVKWSTQKTKLTDPLNTAIAAINTNLISAFDVGPTALTLSTTLGATHYGDFVQTSGASLTHTLTDAATLGAGWHTYLVSTDANDVTIGRATGADTINGSAANITLYGNTVARIFVNAAGNGFIIDHGRISNNTFTPMQFFTAGIGPNYLQNIGMYTAISAKALTVNIATKAIGAASATDPVQIAFRNSTLTIGGYSVVNKTADPQLVAPSGATLGFTASQTGYLYAYALNNAGTVEGIITGSNHWDEGALQSTTAISATADSGNVLYSTTARTNVPIRYIGRIKIQTGAVAGEWDNAPTEVHVSGVSDKDTDEMTAAQRVQSFTASGTWTKPSAAATTDRVLIQAWGGGGGGGGGGSGGTPAGGGGGGGGAYAERIVTISELAATVNLTIQAASAGGGQGAAGTVGGNVTFGSSLTAFGGGAGAAGTAGGVGGGGGGGGGEISAGATSAAGTWSGGAGSAAEVAGVRSTNIWGGGGGGGGSSNSGALSAGGAAYKGGGGGAGGTGSSSTASGGASAHSGNGGTATNSVAGGAGVAPGGGGGGGPQASPFTGGAGAVGQVIVTIL